MSINVQYSVFSIQIRVLCRTAKLIAKHFRHLVLVTATSNAVFSHQSGKSTTEALFPSFQLTSIQMQRDNCEYNLQTSMLENTSRKTLVSYRSVVIVSNATVDQSIVD